MGSPLIKRLDALYQRAQMVMAVQADHAPFVSIAPWSFIKDECIVKYYPEGHYQKPEQIKCVRTKPERTPKNKTVNIIEQNKKEIFMDSCNENVIEFMTNDTRATLSFSQGRYKSVIRKLAEKHPEDCQIIADNEDGSICAHVPVSWLRISPPRQYTEEQRQQMGERLRQNRSENTATQG